MVFLVTTTQGKGNMVGVNIGDQASKPEVVCSSTEEENRMSWRQADGISTKALIFQLFLNIA